MIKLEKANLLVQEEHSSNNIAVIRKKTVTFAYVRYLIMGQRCFQIQ